MKPESTLKIAVSWVVTSLVMISISNLFIDFNGQMQALSFNGLVFSQSILHVLSMLSIAAISLIMHVSFYYGESNSSPIKKGLTLGFMAGLVCFLILVVCTPSIGVHAPAKLLAIGLFRQLLQQVIGGLVISVLSVTEFQRMSVFRWV